MTGDLTRKTCLGSFVYWDTARQTLCEYNKCCQIRIHTNTGLPAATEAKVSSGPRVFPELLLVKHSHTPRFRVTFPVLWKRLFTVFETPDLARSGEMFRCAFQTEFFRQFRRSFLKSLDKSNEWERELRTGAGSGQAICRFPPEEGRGASEIRRRTTAGLPAAWALTCGASRPKSSRRALLKSYVLTQ